MDDAPTPYGWLQPLAADAGLAEPLALTAPEQRVGRTELKTSRKLVSKAHAILAHTAAGAATVEDRSVNGTYLNGARLPQNDPAPLQHGDVVTLLAADSAEFAFVYVAAAALGPPAADASTAAAARRRPSLARRPSLGVGLAPPDADACVRLVRKLLVERTAAPPPPPVAAAPPSPAVAVAAGPPTPHASGGAPLAGGASSPPLRRPSTQLRSGVFTPCGGAAAERVVERKSEIEFSTRES